MKNNKGFTLIEMLIVMAIILMLMLLIIPNAIQKQRALEKQACTAQVKMIETQLVLYELEYNVKIESLDVLVENGYITKEHTKCKGGEPIRIVNGEVEIES